MKKISLILMVFLLMPLIAWATLGKVTIKGTAPESKIYGEMVLVEENGGLTIDANVTNVPPGNHGFHIHEIGSCADSGKAAGGHFNPDKVQHGYLPKDGHQHAHAGDMGNIEVGADGAGKLKLFLPGMTLKDGNFAVSGKSVILHEKEDDFGQPTGNAGARIGCGIIDVTDQNPTPAQTTIPVSVTK